MVSLLIVAIAVAVAVLWLRAARRSRISWLKRLNLPGRWRCNTDTLIFKGAVGGGNYLLTDGATSERGQWQLQGHELILTPNGNAAVKRYDLRYFKPGEIGIDGPGLKQCIYQREADNVIALKAKR